MKRSLLRQFLVDALAGVYNLKVKEEGDALAHEIIVRVVWVGIPPTLAFKTVTPKDIREVLGAVCGKRVELEFVPNKKRPPGV